MLYLYCFYSEFFILILHLNDWINLSFFLNSWNAVCESDDLHRWRLARPATSRWGPESCCTGRCKGSQRTSWRWGRRTAHHNRKWSHIWSAIGKETVIKISTNTVTLLLQILLLLHKTLIHNYWRKILNTTNRST